MATKATPLAPTAGDKNPAGPGRLLDGAVDYGIILILVFTPFAFGGVQPWAAAVMQMLAFAVLGLFLLKEALRGGIRRLTLTPLFIPYASLLAVVFVQTLPLPSGAIAYISGKTAQTYSIFTDGGGDHALALSLAIGETTEGLFRLLSYAAVFFVVVNHCRTKEQSRRLFGAIVFIAIALAVFGAVQKAAWNGKLYWFYPISPALEARASNIFGPYVSNNHFAGYMELAIPLGLGFVLHKYSGFGRSGDGAVKRLAEFSSRAEFAPVVVYSFITAALCAALFMTFSRGGILGFLSSGVFFVALAAGRRSLKKGGAAVVFAGAFMLAFVLFLSWTQLESKFAEMKDMEMFQRPDVWADSIRMWSDFPVLGIGLGAFNAVYRLYQSQYPGAAFEHAENDYVELLSETGVLGAGSFAVMMFLFFYVALKKWRSRHSSFVKCMALGGLSSCVAIIVHSMTDFNMRIPANAMTLTVIAAATYALLFNVQGRARSGGGAQVLTDEERQGRNYPALGAALLFSAFLFFFPLKGLVSEYYSFMGYAALDDQTTDYRDSKPLSQETVSDYMEAARLMETAAYLSPGRARYYKDAADIYATLARWKEAMSLAGAEATGLDAGELYAKSLFNLKKAVELEPSNPWYHLSMAGVLDDLRPGSAVPSISFGRAVSAYPVNVEVRFAAARQHLLKGRMGQAASEAAVVAKTDDSYMSKDEAMRQTLLEERGKAYYKKYGGSYLFGALEIIWRSQKDVKAVKEAAPDNADAAEVLRIFLEHKGLSEE